MSAIKLPKSPARVWLSIIVHGGLAGVIAALAFTSTLKGGGGQFAILGVGGIILYQTFALYKNRNGAIKLLDNQLIDERARLVCALENIERIECGIFALKPTHGFLIILKKPMRWGWNTGLWWRVGHRVGVGGLSAREDGKLMAEQILRIIEQAPNNASR